MTRQTDIQVGRVGEDGIGVMLTTTGGGYNRGKDVSTVVLSPEEATKLRDSIDAALKEVAHVRA